jgi:hypothetical protein
MEVNMEKKKSYTVYFLLVFIMSLSVFLFSATSPFWSAEMEGLDHAFTGSELTRLLGRHVSNYETGLINAIRRLVLYGFLGLAGLHLWSRAGFKGIINDDIKRPRSIIVTVLVGIGMGLYFIVYDVILTNVFRRHILMYPYSLIPASIFSSIDKGIGCQIINMFTVAFIMWLFSGAVKTEEGRARLFSMAVVSCALIFSVRHIESTMFWYAGSLDIFPMSSYMAIIGLYAPLSLVCTYFMRKYGLLSAIGIHFISDIMWRVGWAYIQYGELILRRW